MIWVSEHLSDYTLQVPFAVATGTANTYAISTPIATLSVGMAVSIKINVDGTGASTLNWNGKGAKGIKKASGTNVANLKANGIYTMRYDGVNFILQGEGGDYGAVTSSDVRSGVTFGTENGVQTGTAVHVQSGLTYNTAFTSVTVSGLAFQSTQVVAFFNFLSGSSEFYFKVCHDTVKGISFQLLYNVTGAFVVAAESKINSTAIAITTNGFVLYVPYSATSVGAYPMQWVVSK